MKKIIIIVLAVIVLIGGGALLKKNSKTTVANTTSGPTSNIKGNVKASVKLVQYGDFQCPGCGFFYPILKQVTEKYKDQLAFQFVNFPLTQIHQNAQAAARAGQAAANQGKFWEMHDKLYEGQQAWKTDSNAPATFEEYANQLGLNMTNYKTDYASATTNAIINADIATGQALKVSGTPTFFLDGKQIEDNNTVSTPAKFGTVIEAEILAKTGKPYTVTTPTPTP